MQNKTTKTSKYLWPIIHINAKSKNIYKNLPLLLTNLTIETFRTLEPSLAVSLNLQ